MGRMKSFVPKDNRGGAQRHDPGKCGGGFRGQKRSNQTHQSTTDPEARLRKKAAGQEAKLCFGMPRADGEPAWLYVDLQVRSAVELPRATRPWRCWLGRSKRALWSRQGLSSRAFVQAAANKASRPCATAKGRAIDGLDKRTTVRLDMP